jgi:hypothetical protein
MTEDKMLEGTCECGEKGIIGEICDICGGIYSAGNSSFDDMEDDDLDSYPKDLANKEGIGDVLPLEEVDKEVEEDEAY